MRLLAAELLKIWTAPRTLLGVLLSEVAIVLVGALSTVHSAASGSVLPESLERDVVSVAGTSLLFAILIGVLIATTEYRHGTITLTFLAAPVREKVIAAKTAAAVIASALLVLPAVVVSLGVAQIWVGGRSDYHFGAHEWGLVGRLFLGAAIVAMIGVFIGASLKRQLGAIILVLGWLIFFENALRGFFPGTMDYLTGPSVSAILGGGGQDTPTFGHSVVVIAVYLVALGTVAVALTRRRDIT